MDLERLLLRVRNEAAPTILPEAAVARLAEHAERYAEQIKRPRFATGALVTPVADCDLKGPGEPHRVIDVRFDAMPTFAAGQFMNTLGCRLDIRVICVRDDSVCAFWTESFKFEPWTAAAAEAADVRAAD